MSIDTHNVYETKAAELAQYFRSYGSRTKQITRAFELSGKQEPSVLELGCGDGRDAKVICSKTRKYTGVDYSKALIVIAREYVDGAVFVHADMAQYKFPKNIDIIFAFASLLHLDSAELELIFKKAATSLNGDGIFYLSTKKGNNEQKIKVDQFGRRVFYHYAPEFIESIAAKRNFRVIDLEDDPKGDVPWFNMALKLA